MQVDSKPRVLVVYSSQTGCTKSYAEAIQETLENNGCLVVSEDASCNPLPQHFDAVITMGSAYAARWQSCISEWVRAHSAELANTVIGSVIVCLSILNPQKEQSTLAWMTSVFDEAQLRPKATLAVPGWYLSSMLSFSDRMIMKMVGTKEGDYRNFELAKNWANGFANLIG